MQNLNKNALTMENVDCKGPTYILLILTIRITSRFMCRVVGGIT